MTNKSPHRSIRTLFAMVALLALMGTASACSSSSDSADKDAPADADELLADSDSDSDSDDAGSLPADFPAIPLPEYDSVSVMGAGQKGSGQYSGRATFTNDAYQDKPVEEMIDAYGEILVAAGFSELSLSEQGDRIRGHSTQPGKADGDNNVDITVDKDRPGDLEIGGAHWESVGDQ